MTLEPKQYTRKTFGVEAIQVTAENIEAVAKWCGGVVIVSETTLHEFIRLNEENAAFRRHITAFPGDWVALGSNGFRVYQKGSFESMFDEVSGNEDKVAKIEEFVRKAMVAQDAATYLGESSAGMGVVCHEIALQIAQVV